MTGKAQSPATSVHRVSGLTEVEDPGALPQTPAYPQKDRTAYVLHPGLASPQYRRDGPGACYLACRVGARRSRWGFCTHSCRSDEAAQLAIGAEAVRARPVGLAVSAPPGIVIVLPVPVCQCLPLLDAHVHASLRLSACPRMRGRPARKPYPTGLDSNQIRASTPSGANSETIGSLRSAPGCLWQKSSPMISGLTM